MENSFYSHIWWTIVWCVKQQGVPSIDSWVHGMSLLKPVWTPFIDNMCDTLLHRSCSIQPILVTSLGKLRRWRTYDMNILRAQHEPFDWWELATKWDRFCKTKIHILNCLTNVNWVMIEASRISVNFMWQTQLNRLLQAIDCMFSFSFGFCIYLLYQSVVYFFELFQFLPSHSYWTFSMWVALFVFHLNSKTSADKILRSTANNTRDDFW